MSSSPSQSVSLSISLSLTLSPYLSLSQSAVSVSLCACLFPVLLSPYSIFVDQLCPSQFCSACLHHSLPAVPPSPGRPFDPSLLLAQATCNIICSLVFDLRLPYDNEEFQAVVRAAGGIAVGVSSPWGQVSGWDPSLATFPKGSCPPLPGNPRAPCPPAPPPWCRAPMETAVVLPTDLRDVLPVPTAPPGPPHAAPRPLGHRGRLRRPAGVAAQGEPGHLRPRARSRGCLPAEDGKGGEG